MFSRVKKIKDIYVMFLLLNSICIMNRTVLDISIAFYSILSTLEGLPLLMEILNRFSSVVFVCFTPVLYSLTIAAWTSGTSL